MTANKFKTLALFGAVALGLAFTSGSAKAQDTVNVSITQNAAITTTDVADMGFGTWFLAVVGGDDFTLTMDSGTGAVADAGRVGSFATVLTPGSGFGQVNVGLPAGANGIVLQMTASAITDFADAGLTLQNLTYDTATEGTNQSIVSMVSEPVTVVTGGTDEVVTFGGQINVTATPAAGAHTASFDVTFAF